MHNPHDRSRQITGTEALPCPRPWKHHAMLCGRPGRFLSLAGKAGGVWPRD